MKFTLFAPNFVHYSAGVRALYLLGEYLIDLGHEVDAVNYQDMPFKDKPPIGCRMRFIDSKDIQKSVVIVPEVLDLKTNLPILRWCLNHPGLLSGPKTYGPNEMVVYYSDEYAESARAAAIDGVAHELCIGTIEPFVNSNKPKLFDLYYEGKGVSDSSHGLDAIRLTRHWPPTRPELVWLLDRCENFYSYDDNSAINLESYILGCNTYLRKFGEWQEYKPDRPERFLYNPTRDRENVVRIVNLLTAALQSE
jgi:hypothetical protein